MDYKTFPLIAVFLSLFLAQGLKPFTYYLRFRKFDIKQLRASGGLPSSHTSLVSALAFSVGLRDSFTSTEFLIAFVLSLIVAYDAMNVRYFAGENIRITRKLISDLQSLIPTSFNQEDYKVKLKEVLGHTELEVVAGYLLGLIVTGVLYLFV